MTRKYEIKSNGSKFFNLIIIEYLTKNNRRYYYCLCDCGIKKLIRKESIDNETTKSCGCLKRFKRNYKKENRIGKRYGKLIVDSKFCKSRKTFYICLCDCGNKSIVESSALRKTKSCGCISKERKSIEENLERQIFHSYNGSARKRGYIFELTRDQVSSLINSNCVYCGKGKNNPVKNVHRLEESRLFNGIDRVDNTKGYSINNCVPCCKNCNLAKYTRTQEEFLEWVDTIAKFRGYIKKESQ